VEILKDKYGGSQGLIREIAGGQERLVDIGGQAVATCRPSTTLPATITVPTSTPAIACRGWPAEKTKFLGKAAEKQGEVSARIYIVTRCNSHLFRSVRDAWAAEEISRREKARATSPEGPGAFLSTQTGTR